MQANVKPPSSAALYCMVLPHPHDQVNQVCWSRDLGPQVVKI